MTEPVLAADLIARQARVQAEAERAGETSTGTPAGEHRADAVAVGVPTGGGSPASTASSEVAAASGADLSAAFGSDDDHAAAAAAAAAAADADAADADAADPAMADTDPPLRSRGGESVLVIDGRPRYHLRGCEFLSGRDAEPVPLRQAVEDGFTPCALCDPDSGLAAGVNQSRTGADLPDA